MASRKKAPRAAAGDQHRASRGEPHPWTRRALAAAIVVAGLWAYAPGLTGVFVLDDVRAVVRNASTRSWSSALTPPPQSTVSGRPVANLSFALTYALAPAAARETFVPAQSEALFRQNSLAYHAVNLLIHLAAALLLFGVVGRTLRSPRLRERYEAGATSIAFATAVVWVVHPLNTEAVTYVVQRVESLMGLFFLLTLYCAIRAAEASAGVARRWQAAAVTACALGMGTKEVMVGAPLVVLAWDWLFLTDRRPRWRFACVLASTWIVLALLVFGERRTPSVELRGDIVWRYLLTQGEVIVHYLRLSIYPSPLVFLYTWPLAASVRSVALPGLFVVGLAALTVFGLMRRHPAAFAGAVFFVVLAPSSSVLPIVTEVAAEHRMYLPLAALLPLAGTLGSDLDFRLGRGRKSRSDPRVPVAVVAIVVAAGLAVVARERNRDYSSEERLWADTVAKQPGNTRARVAYGSALAAAGKPSDAAEQFQAAVAIDPDDPIAQARLGSTLAALGQYDAAIPHLERALSVRPDDVDAHRALGQIYAIKQDDARAAEHLSRAVEAIPNDPALAARLAAILAGSANPMVRDPRRALVLAERAAILTSRREPLVLNILAVALAGAGRLPEAAATAREAIPLARAQGNQPLVTELERRAQAYSAPR